MRHWLAFGVIWVLAGCGDPIADMPRLSDADIPEEPTTLSALPDEAEMQGGFFARVFGDVDAQKTDETPDKPMPPEAYGATSDLAETPQPKRGFLASLLSPVGEKADRADDTQTLPKGMLLPYGKLSRVCGLTKREMGKRVDQFATRQARHDVYDSSPGSAAPRNFYLTGFSDGCARQFTASVAIFGSVEMHEQLRYGLPSEVQPYSQTDKAYERLKSRVCGVGRRKPCGNKRSLLDGNTVFLSIYENFGGNERWSNLLLHEGELLAQDIKG